MRHPGAVRVRAEDEPTITSIGGAGALDSDSGPGVAAGAAIAVNSIASEVIAAIDEAVVEAATADLVGADFGLGAMQTEDLARLSEMLRPVRAAAGDF